MVRFKIPTGDTISFDCETTGLSPRLGDRAYCVSFCNIKGDTSVISFPVDPFTREVTYSPEIEIIQAWAADKSIKKTAHNAQFDVRFLEVFGTKIEGEIVCTMNLIRLLKSDEPLALKEFCSKHLGIPVDDEEALRRKTMQKRREGREKGWKIFEGKSEDGSLAPDYWLAGPKYYEPYCVMDSVRAMAVYTKLLPGIKELGLEKLWDSEQKIWKILRKVEDRGIRIYRKKVLSYKEDIKKKQKIYLTQAERIGGTKINLRSPKQLQDLLFRKLNLESPFQTQTGSPSTDVASLKAIKHPVCKAILNVRACNKTIEFMDQYLETMVRHEDKQWYIHANLHQSRASTGRMSCSNPNLQQVASGENDNGVEIRVEARSVFGPRPNYVLRSYDWKNIEVYIPAFKSKDKKLTEILLAGGDVHEHTAKALTKRIGEPITRFAAKRTFFGLQYGIGTKKLAKTLGIGDDLAELIVLNFPEEYPTLFDWMENIKFSVRRKGYIETAYGRRCSVSSREEYKAINYYVQGTAADILKQAHIKLDQSLRGWDAFEVLPVHDEILMEIGKAPIPEIDSKVVRCMQDNPELEMPVPIPVSISAIGSNWAKKEKVRVV